MFVRPWNLMTILLAGSMLTMSIGCGEQPAGTQGEADPAKTEAEVPTPTEEPQADAAEESTPEADAPAETAPESAEKTDEPQADGNASTTLVDVRGMTFSAPADWQLSANPGFVEAELTLPGDDGTARMTVMAAGGDKDSNIQRWISQFKREEGDEPSIGEIEVDGRTAAQVDIRGTFSGQRPGQPPQANARMLAFIIPFNASHHYFVKVTGPKSTVGQHEAAIIEFVKTGKRK